jgi:serine/threonine protein kinase
MAIDPQRLQRIFRTLATIPSPAERAAFLERECGSDAELRQRLEGMLNAPDDPPAPADEGRGPTVDSAPGDAAGGPSAEVSGSVIGPYTLLQKLGEGGMGAVWVAEQHQPVKRRVALKVIKPGMDSAQVLRRFEIERQALALMDHTNIAKVFDAGATPEGRPYIAMELVPGVPITRYCDELNLPIHERLELFVPVCRAIQHAHQKGVIHRDLKPSNVLVCMQDGRPVPKVIDFGVAKALNQRLTEETVFTEFGAVVGTLEYMAPEQAEMSPLGVDTRADVYSLGVLLYELLTSTTPLERPRLRQAALVEVLRIIKEEEPPRPSTRLSASKHSLASVAARRRTEPGRLMKEVRGELDWIVMKCLEKDRTRRYETALGLARDVERYLADEPVTACPPSAAYRLRKFARKHRAGLAAAAAFAVLLAAGAAVGTWQAVRATAAEARARRSEAQALAERDETEQARQEAVSRAAEARAASMAEKQARELAERRLAHLEKANDLLAAIFHDVNPRDLSRRGEDDADPNLRERLGRRLEEAAAQLGRAGIDDPKALARLQGTLGISLCNLGRPGPAVALLRQAYATRKDLLGPDDPETLASMLELVTAYHLGGQRDQALPLAEEALARSKARFGPDDPRTLASMNNLALVYRDTGMPDQAVHLLQEIREMQKGRPDTDDARVLMTQHNLANAYLAAGQPDQAIPLLEETLARRKVKHGPDHFATLRTEESLGRAYLAAHRLDEALPLLEEAARKQEIKLGLGHPDTLASLSRLASAYQAAGRPGDAVRPWEQVLEARRTLLGPADRLTVDAENRLGVCLTAAGRFAEAERHLLDSYRGLRQVKEAGPDAVWRYCDHLMALYEAWGKPDQVDRWGREIVTVGKNWLAHLGPNDQPNAALLARMGFALLREHEYADAEPVLRQCLAIREKREPDAWATFNARSMLGEALLGRQKYAEAEPLLKAGYEGLKQREAKVPPAAKVRLAESLERLVRLYEATGKKDEAARWRLELDGVRPAPKGAK